VEVGRKRKEERIGKEEDKAKKKGLFEKGDREKGESITEWAGGKGVAHKLHATVVARKT